MKRVLMSLTCIALFGCGTNETPSTVASAQSTKLTATDLVGSYTGQGGEDATGPCHLTFKIEREGLFFTPYLVVQLNDDTFSAKVSDVDASLAKQTSDNPDVWIDASETTGILSQTARELQLIYHDGRFDSVHYQTASFSGGWISGTWHVVDCSNLVSVAR